ncbi:GNAT family N-acetyltransferase [Halomicrococcus gelatinilyticus]|uniref:GNAT family N-acetyltransferase n=1 Tax=Halomicrococcus gelatinilyticus TaxID=1702103 RepID=UPI002E160671
MVSVEVATGEHVDRVTDLWVDLARDQRAYGSHLYARANRVPVRERIARHVVNDTLLVARDSDAVGSSDDSAVGSCDGSDVVGFVTFDVETGPYAQDVTRGLVRNVFVAEGHRDEGVGSALLAAAEVELADRGADVVQLEVLADNEAAKRFYRRAGYEPRRIQMEKSVESDNHSKE